MEDLRKQYRKLGRVINASIQKLKKEINSLSVDDPERAEKEKQLRTLKVNNEHVKIVFKRTKRITSKSENC